MLNNMLSLRNMNQPQIPSPDQFPQPGAQSSEPQMPPPPAPPANPLQQSGSPLPGQPLQAQAPAAQQPVGQPPAQQGPAGFQPAGLANDPTWLKIMLIFGGGFAITILPLFLGYVIYLIQFGFAGKLIVDGRKNAGRNQENGLLHYGRCHVPCGSWCPRSSFWRRIDSLPATYKRG